MRKTESILDDLNNLVRSKGYIYALCMLILEEFHYDIEHLHDVNYKDHLGIQEVSLLVGFLLHKPIDFSYPTHPSYLLRLKKASIELMKELEQSLIRDNQETIKQSLQKGSASREAEVKQLNFFVKEGSIVEPIIYSGNGTRLYPYDTLLKAKYENDEDWLAHNCGFTITQAIKIINRIQDKLHKNFKHFYSFMMKGKRNRTEDFNVGPDAWQYDFYPYLDLFNEIDSETKQTDISQMSEKNWEAFYKNILNLFVLHRDDFGQEDFVEAFLQKFTTDQVAEYNTQFNSVGDFNYFRTRPILLLEPNGKRYFIPLSFMLYAILYEAPTEWMVEDKAYRSTIMDHTAEFGNNLTCHLLSNIYYPEQMLRNVTVKCEDGNTQKIDIICVINNKALCVQVRSDRITEISRYDNNREVLLEFKRAIQEIYNTGLNHRKSLLNCNSELFDQEGNPIILSQPIDEVFLMGVTTKNYPTITHQAHLFLRKKEDDPFPVFTTIFELEILLHYMKNPFLLLYYLRQRSKLTNYFIATEEMAYLGYHLCHKLQTIPDTNEVFIDNIYAQYIDQNYYPFKFGVDKWIDESKDPIKNRWHNPWFERICKQIKRSQDPDKIDILFHLFDIRPMSVDRIVSRMRDLKEEVKKDKEISYTSAYISTEKLGLSYFVAPSESIVELSTKLNDYCNLHKYMHQAQYWIGLGNFAFSNRPYDLLIYRKDPWVQDKKMSKEVKKRRFSLDRDQNK
ncbi:hypothetical protein [Bacteroides coprosuis]|uniref:hypothetical protein n=1 Tax=Bacteroides coprosuis TaxID=151276 RepID=UPI001DC4B054|nr:hypothetical protein [Bacteroides coprosuis]HJD93061.1 hypothetical protein [Bacteroides coprosuis]